MADMNNTMAANAEFEKEKNVGLNLDQLSYICDYCGKVNQIGAPRCVRCGKRRPRSEYIDAMNKVKNAKTVKAEYLEEQYKAEADRKDAAQQQIVRLVESRVEDEKQSIIAQESLRVEQERDAIKKSTAREAVLRIIAAEKAAEDKVKAAEERAEEASKGRSKEIEGVVDEEKRKVLEVAAQKVVAARAGIEEAAREQIEANKKIADRFVHETLNEEKDKAQRSAARRAVLQIIAAENAAEEKIKVAKDALQQAAVERIVEERILADKEASSRYLAQKQAIERAADERIKAEKEAIKRLLEEKQGYSYQAPAQAYQGQSFPQQAVQPLAIVPYLNSNQPVYQYRPNQVYRFVPKARDAAVSTPSQAPAGYDMTENAPIQASASPAVQKVKSGKGKVRIAALAGIVISAAILILCLLAGGLMPIIQNIQGMDMIEGLLSKLGVSLGLGTAPAEISLVTLIGYGAFILFAALSLIQNLIRLISGKAVFIGFIIPALSVAGLAVAAATASGIAILGTAVLGVAVLLLTLITIIGGKKTKKAIA